MKVYIQLISLLTLILVVATLVNAAKQTEDIGVEQTTAYFEAHTNTFDSLLLQLQHSVKLINNKETNSINNAKKLFSDCRREYKNIEFFTEYFFDHTSNIFNRPAAYEIEITGLEYQDPIGLQVIESILMDKNVFLKKDLLLQHTDALISVIHNIKGLLFNKRIKDDQILESVRLELIRIGTLGITGYDAPLIKTGLAESRQALLSIENILQPYFTRCDKTSADSVEYYLHYSSLLLTKNNFDSFDRLHFYTAAMFPLQHFLGKMIAELHLDLNTSSFINYDASNLFSPDFFNKISFISTNDSLKKDKVMLGKKLFFDKALSGNKSRSCATCHQPDKFFTDGLPKNFSFSGTPMKRNTPSLLYSVFQHVQFLDGRATDLANQATTVISNISEMNGNPHSIISFINKKSVYKKLFEKAFPAIKEPVSFETISKSLEAYESTLTPFTSAFDNYISGNEHALTRQQKLGFNLFTGKAKCATCHFIPLFNGLLPPAYATTEFEILGVPANNNFLKPVLDKDSGQYQLVPLPFTAGSFKTPTVRNSGATAPYMHNGSLTSLKRVMEFYNKGGGKGLGMKINYQTLPEKPLNLTDNEIIAIISFINSLTDQKEFNHSQAKHTGSSFKVTAKYSKQSAGKVSQ